MTQLTVGTPTLGIGPVDNAARPIVASLSQQVYQWMKHRIFTGQFQPNQRLDIDALASEIGVSRTPVRDAINELARDGLIVVHSRRGTTVAALTLDDVTSNYDARALVEPPIAAEAARKGARARVEALVRIQEESEALDAKSVYGDFAAHSKYAELDAAFHVGIGASIGNPRITELLDGINIQRRIAPLVFGTDYSAPDTRIAEHRLILAALLERDSRATMREVRKHILRARAQLVAFLDRMDRGAPLDG